MDDLLKEVRIAYEAVSDKKGEDIKVLNISQISTIADYFVIATGSNLSQIRAMADEVDEKLSKAGLHAKYMEGYQKAEWILLDFGPIIVHLFNRENREFYDLERIWADADEVIFEEQEQA